MAIKYEKDKNNIVTLTMDMDGKSINIINENFCKVLIKSIDQIEAESNLNGVILTSAKKTFLGGADLQILYEQFDPQSCFDVVEKIKQIFRRLELIKKPVVAAVNGTAVGGGMELALCCHYRIVLNNPQATFGFPEVNLGILPGGGGITRLTRMIGIEASLPFLAQGKHIGAEDTIKYGLMNELASNQDDLMFKATSWIQKTKEYQQPWDKPGFKFPNGNAHHPKTAKMLAIAPAIIRKKTRGNYPAPEAVLSAAAEGSLVNFDTASKIETRFFVNLATGKKSKNMMNAFWFQMNKIKQGESRPSMVLPIKTSKVGVLGAGLMGHGIAYTSALAKMNVVLLDKTDNKVQEGFQRITDILINRVKKGILTKNNSKKILDRISATSDYSLLQGCDLIIEAVYEDRHLKAQATSKAEAVMAPDGVFASNTSTIPITSLAKQSSRPENFIGMHFFSPVHKMKLVEIIKGEKTKPETLAKAFDFVLKIKKIPIVVNDCRGFYTSRVFEKYTCEGMALLSEGQSALAIEKAGKDAGFPVGPLAVIDEINLKLAAQIRSQTWEDLRREGKKVNTGPWDAVIDIMTKKAKRTGRSDGGGFYEYPKDRAKHIWSDIEKYFPKANNQHTQKEIIDRLYFSQVLEAVRCYEDGVVTSVADANIGSIFGWGFPAFKGGVLHFINDYGISQFVQRANRLANKYGERFSPPQLLIEMAKSNKTF